jgi:hypothetical protein
VDLNLEGHYISADNWAILCESLKAHPTLTGLDLQNTCPANPSGVRISPAEDQKAHRTRLLAEMVQQNTILLTIKIFDEIETDEQIYAKMIPTRLETNRYRPRVLAIKKADISLHRALLGRALQAESVRNEIPIFYGCSCRKILMLWCNRMKITS